MPPNTQTQYPTQSEVVKAKSMAVGGKKDKCVKGKSCSAACIAANKMCLVELPEVLYSSLRRVASFISKPGKNIVEAIKKKSKEIRSAQVEREESRIKKIDPDTVDNKFIKQLMKIKSVDVSVRGNAKGEIYDIKISKKVGKHRISVNLEDNGTTFSFTVNGTYEKPRGLTNREGLQIAKETEDIFSKVVKSMANGSAVEVYTYDKDGRGSKRRKAYERFGFAPESKNAGGGSFMYGKVYNGEVTGSSYEEYRSFMREKNFNFSEMYSDRVLTMYVALWGEDPF